MTKVVVHPALTDRTLGPVEYARHVVDRGLHGVYLPEHTHIPVDFEPGDYPNGLRMPDRYRRLLDPVVALSFVAAHLSVEIGTCVCLVAEHDPIALAKSVATLDLLSGGRFVFGVGFGWNSREFANHSVIDAARRPDVVREHVELMSALWRDEIAEYQGTHRRLARAWSWPKPLRTPRPPVLLGGRGTRRNFERIASWADGWISPDGSLLGPDYPARLDLLRTIWADHGRDPLTLMITALEDPQDGAGVVRQYRRAEELGVARLILHVADRPIDTVLPSLDDVAALVNG